jgi:hypothetical protein
MADTNTSCFMSGNDFGNWFTISNVETYFARDLELAAVEAHVIENCGMCIGVVVSIFSGTAVSRSAALDYILNALQHLRKVW